MESAKILQNILPCFRIDSHKGAASQEDIRLLENFSGIQVPEDYLDLVQVMTEVEILVNSKNYVRIWGPLRCIEMNEAYQIQKYISNSLAIGDDEGGKALIPITGKQGYGLYITGFGDLDADSAEFIAPTLHSFFVDGVGVNTV
ncbi:hypothetical protein UNDYM_2333 [Undibacterium sp. YM2]|uniref:SMI1/KNR4 family protein n=1 Tax=Undibacterium sp. YM2 TaxID=2058625 RepID=UPI001331CF87|nr:SMI1/KNR4 family protein [Undibacterium sp. YM2]BBB66586.1 hypothetical protein UNDYM_2333 [Undibacterium sp. YM2]